MLRVHSDRKCFDKKTPVELELPTTEWLGEGRGVLNPPKIKSNYPKASGRCAKSVSTTSNRESWVSQLLFLLY